MEVGWHRPGIPHRIEDDVAIRGELEVFLLFGSLDVDTGSFSQIYQILEVRHALHPLIIVPVEGPPQPPK
jgi:hypothetical protein